MNSTGSQQTNMASKSRGKQRGEDIQQEDVFQAVVIADSFNVRFAPITNEKPKVISNYFLTTLLAADIQYWNIWCDAIAREG